MSLVSVAGAFGAKENSDHAKLLCKLSYYGIHGIISDWFESYLTDRTQTTQVEASISTKGKILFGSVYGVASQKRYIGQVHRFGALCTAPNSVH